VTTCEWFVWLFLDLECIRYMKLRRTNDISSKKRKSDSNISAWWLLRSWRLRQGNISRLQPRKAVPDHREPLNAMLSNAVISRTAERTFQNVIVSICEVETSWSAIATTQTNRQYHRFDSLCNVRALPIVVF
jgi:hypothetical protein